jgi:hypothetical protein
VSVPFRNVTDSRIFSVTHKNFPSVRSVQAANLVCRNAGMFRKAITLIKQILY